MNGLSDFSEILRSLSQANLIRVGLIIAGAWLLIVLNQRFLSLLANRLPGRMRPYLLAMTPVLQLLIIMGAFAFIIPLLIEPTFENLVALLGALGFALGFAFKDYVSSLIAGVVTLYEMPYRPGDWIEVNGAYGEVRAINMRTVEIVTPDDTVVVIVDTLGYYTCV